MGLCGPVAVYLFALSLPLCPSLRGLRCPGGGGPTGQVMGQEAVSWDEITPQDGRTPALALATSSDVTRDLSSQWKHGARFTVRTAQSLPLADPTVALPPLLPVPVPGAQCALCFPPPHSLVYSLMQQISV